MHTFFSSRIRRIDQAAPSAGLGLALALIVGIIAATGPARAQAVAESRPEVSAESSAEGRDRILLVLPFDNRTGQPSLEWIREAAPEILSSRFASAGFAPMSRDGPAVCAGPSGAAAGVSSLAGQFAEAGADAGRRFDRGGQLSDRRHRDCGRGAGGGCAAPAHERAGERARRDARPDCCLRLAGVEADPAAGSRVQRAEETFVAAGAGLRLDAFEQYIRGITEPDQAERLRHLKQAVKLSPEFGPAWMALGREDYNGQQYEQAAAAFAKVDARAIRMRWRRASIAGLSLLFSGDYPKAERRLRGVARVLPLAEVVNNEGVAVSRPGHDGTALFQSGRGRRSQRGRLPLQPGGEPEAAGQYRRGLDRAGPVPAAAAQRQRGQALTGCSGEPAAPPAAGSAAESDAEPKARSAGADCAQLRCGCVPPGSADAGPDGRCAAGRARAASSGRRRWPARRRTIWTAGCCSRRSGCISPPWPPTAAVAEAHAGLAEVRERTGDADAARKEARASLELDALSRGVPCAGAAGSCGWPPETRPDNEATDALALEPANRAAQELRQQIEAREGQKK